MKKAAKNAPFVAFRTKPTQEELERTRQTVRELQEKFKELEKKELEKQKRTQRFSITEDDGIMKRLRLKELQKRILPPQKRISPPQKRISPPQKRISLPIQFQRNSPQLVKRNSLPTIIEGRRSSSSKSRASPRVSPRVSPPRRSSPRCRYCKKTGCYGTSDKNCDWNKVTKFVEGLNI